MSQSAIEQLAAMPRFVTGICLRRMSALLEQQAFAPPPSIAVTGSKGKGSVAAMTDALLRSLGLRTVRHTSPHFLVPSERIALNGTAVSPKRFDELLFQALDASRTVARKYEETFARFEILFAASILLAREERADCMILEGGIGGRFDPTSVVQPKLFGLTSVELEHVDHLGSTVDQIACDKLDIGANDSVAMVGAIDPALLSRVTYYASRRNVRLVRAADRFPFCEYDEDADGPLARLKNGSGGPEMSVRLPLSGQFQMSNAAVALALGEHFIRSTTGQEVDWIATANAAWRDVSWPGRLQVVYDAPKIVVDAAHTPESIRGVTSTLLRWRSERRILLVGVSADKDWRSIAGILLQLDAPVVVSRSDARGQNPDDVAGVFSEGGGDVLAIEADLKTALDFAMREAKSAGASLYVLGSLFLAANVVRLLNGGSPDDAIVIG
jgi:dihydrofolate synthase/folylpolyglutamate synthase